LAAVSRPLALALIVMLAFVGAAGCGADKESKGSATATAGTATRSTTGRAPSPRPAICRQARPPTGRRPERLAKPTLALAPKATWLANVFTSCGRFAITLDVKHAPKTASSFASLARLGFYDGLTFHRVVHGFVLQGGDPRGNGTGGPGYQTVEAPPGDLRYTRGVVAMAKQEIEDPGTAGSQFFVVVGPDAQLPAEYALVGRVTAGMDTVDRIAVVPTEPNTDRPLRTVVIDAIRIVSVKER
jgi:peptidyl-prolyl cis-trans isomerase B (cyclophilin B)